MADKITVYLSNSLTIAQVSDTNMPTVYNPGAKLARRAREAGFRVVPAIDASTVTGTLNMTDVTEPGFYFDGFLPPKSGE